MLLKNLRGTIDSSSLSLLQALLKPGASILDVGFGTGITSYHLWHKIAGLSIAGVDIESRKTLEKKLISISLVEEPGWEGLELFDYYEFYNLVARKYLNSNPLSRESFSTTFGFLFNKSFREYVLENKNSSHFDLILLSNVLHYEEMGDIDEVFSDAALLLEDHGLLYVSFTTYIIGRRQLNPGELLTLLGRRFTVLSNQEDDCEEFRVNIVCQKHALKEASTKG